MSQLSSQNWASRCRNDALLLREMIKPGICSISSNSANTVVTVNLNVPTYIVPQSGGSLPELASSHTLEVHFPREYPYAKPIVRFPDPSKRAAHPNVFQNGWICIGPWVEDPSKNTDGILGVMNRCIECLSFSETQVNLNSPATRDWTQYYLDKKSKGEFPLWVPWWKGKGALVEGLATPSTLPSHYPTRNRIVLH